MCCRCSRDTFGGGWCWGIQVEEGENEKQNERVGHESVEEASPADAREGGEALKNDTYLE